MRNHFVKKIIEYCNTEKTFFLTGDVGFMCLEDIQKSFKNRFINCGISEQNMISVAAGLAQDGCVCFVYSIAPFVYARPYEQIRNDICFSEASVCLVGNGGGYGYGHMGPTHHALEDCAAMHALGVEVIVPCFDEDIEVIIQNISRPTYLRLGYDTKPKECSVPPWAPWRCVMAGENGVWVTLGPLSGLAMQVLQKYEKEKRPALWACSGFSSPPEEFINSVKNKKLVVFEEHVKEGGLGMYLSYFFLDNAISVYSFSHRYALRYPSKLFGSQDFHRGECRMDAVAMEHLL